MRNGHKYGAVKTVVDNITFASKAEAKRYGELKMLEKAGKIECLQLQPRYALIVSGGDGIGDYVADFKYFPKGGNAWVTEDVKGFKTALYRWKKKHVEAQYGITITEISR